MSGPGRDASILALALLATEGAGRVAAGRLVERFGSYQRLVDTPLEQVLARLPGVPRAEDLVKRLRDRSFEERLGAAEAEVASLSERRIAVLTCRHPHWPTGFGELDRGDRPVVLYVFGDTSVLGRRMVAFLARPPLEGPSFERAQDVLRKVMEAGLVPVIGLQHGFDTVACKLAAGAGRPAIALASAGLARVPGPMRPAGAALTRAGGVLASSFQMDHGPFAHDDVERARLATAMASATVAVGAPDDAPELRAIDWALDHDRPVFTTKPDSQPALRPVIDEKGLHALLELATEEH